MEVLVELQDAFEDLLLSLDGGAVDIKAVVEFVLAGVFVVLFVLHKGVPDLRVVEDLIGEFGFGELLPGLEIVHGPVHQVDLVGLGDFEFLGILIFYKVLAEVEVLMGMVIAVGIWLDLEEVAHPVLGVLFGAGVDQADLITLRRVGVENETTLVELADVDAFFVDDFPAFTVREDLEKGLLCLGLENTNGAYEVAVKRNLVKTGYIELPLFDLDVGGLAIEELGDQVGLCQQSRGVFKNSACILIDLVELDVAQMGEVITFLVVKGRQEVFYQEPLDNGVVEGQGVRGQLEGFSPGRISDAVYDHFCQLDAVDASHGAKIGFV